MGDFEKDTCVTPLSEQAWRFHANISPDWKIWGPNGGYLAAIALRAAGHVARIGRPASLSCHMLSVPEFREVQLEVEILRSGRSAESLRVVMRQGERRILEALVRTAREGSGIAHEASKMPAVKPAAELPVAYELHGPYPFWGNLEPRTVWPERLSREREPHDPVWLEWLRFIPTPTFSDPFVDAGRLLVLIDSFSFPAAIQPHPAAAVRAPNLDVTAWFHRLEPESEWLLIHHESPVAAHGLVGTRADVWSQSGQLLASGGSQLLCQPSG